MSFHDDNMPFSVNVRQITQDFARANPGKDDGRSEIAANRGSVMVLQIHGNINRDTWPRLVEKADELLNLGRINLVFDLHQVEDITSSGLIALQTIAKRAVRRGGRAVVCRPTRQVRRIFEVMADFENDTFPDEESAVQTIERGASKQSQVHLCPEN